MDRALVYTETEDDGNVYFISNIPFELIPEGFIIALRDRDFVEMEYYANCKFYNESEVYWNLLGLTKKGKPVVFVWGMFDRLEKILCISRISIHPLWQSCNSEFLRLVVKNIIDYSSKVGANSIIIISNKPKPLLRKLKGLFKLSDSVVLESVEGVHYV